MSVPYYKGLEEYRPTGIAFRANPINIQLIYKYNANSVLMTYIVIGEGNQELQRLGPYEGAMAVADCFNLIAVDAKMDQSGYLGEVQKRVTAVTSRERRA